MAKGDSPISPVEPVSLADSVKTVVDELAAVNRAIRRKALAGQDTAEARRRCAQLEHRIDELRSGAEATSDDADRALAQKTADIAAIVAKAAVQVIDDTVSRLKSPKKPEMPK
jgi:hypothetical protein